MKKIITYTLILILMLPMALKLGVFMWYFQNKTYIATTLCINRNQPELACEGVCQLNKQLKKLDCCAADSTETSLVTSNTESSKQPQPAKANSRDFEIAPYICQSSDLIRWAVFEQAQCLAHFSPVLHTRLVCSEVFEPPRLV